MAFSLANVWFSQPAHRPRHRTRVKVGPLIDAKSRGKVHGLVTDAVAAGATAVLGGGPVDGPGYFHQPTVLTGVTEGTRMLSEEIFGLVAYVFTKDLNRGLRMGERLETGMLGLNAGVISNAAAPFGDWTVAVTLSTNLQEPEPHDAVDDVDI